MNEIEKKIMATLGPEYDHSAKPHVYFFDFADLITPGKRPRYRNAVYISKRSKTALDTAEFRRRANEADKQEFPREWEHYLKVRENLKHPKVDLLPGIDQATLMEMRDMGLFNLQQLLEQDDFVQWADMARRILNAINSERSEGRDRVFGDAQFKPERVLAQAGAGTGITPGYSANGRTIANTGGNPYPFTYQGQKESYPQASEVSWSFEMSQ